MSQEAEHRRRALSELRFAAQLGGNGKEFGPAVAAATVLLADGHVSRLLDVLERVLRLIEEDGRP